MTIAEQIVQHIKNLPEATQKEILSLVESLESKMERVKEENVNWSDISLSQAMRGMETEALLYTIDDVREKFESRV